MTDDGPKPSAEDLEAEVLERLRGHRLVCEVDWEPELLARIRPSIYADWYAEMSGSMGYGRHPALLVLYLVLTGREEYDGDFWPHTVMGADGRVDAGRYFEAAVRRLRLEQFPQFAAERALRFVAPILAHGGIPQTFVLPFLRDTMLPALARAEGETAIDYIARWRHRRPAGMPQPVRRYLLYGGETATDFLARCLDLPTIGRDALRAEPAVAGLPRNVVEAFLSLPPQAIAPVLRLPAPTVRIDVWSRRGPEMLLPAVGRDLAAGLRWTVDDGATAHRLEASPHRETVIPLVPADGWTGSATTGGRTLQHTFECFAESPIVCFDGEGRYVPDTGSLRADQIWVLMPVGVTLARADSDGTQHPLVPTDEADRPGGAWSGHHVARYDLAGVELLHVVSGDAIEYRVPVYRPGAGAEIVGVPVADVRSIDDLRVYDAMPTLSLPPWGAWNVGLVGEMDAATWTVTPEGGARSSVDLSTAEPAFGRYEVIARGPLLGRDLRTAFVVIPGLRLETPEEPLATGETEVTVTAVAAADIGLAGRPPGEPVTLTVTAEAGSEEVWAWRGHRKTGILARIRVLQWAFREADGALELGRVPLRLDPDRVGVEDIALVVTGRPGRGVRLLLDAGGERLAEFARPNAGDGQATFDLGLVRETVRDHRARHLTLIVETSGLVANVAAYEPPPPPVPPRPRPGEAVRARVVGPDHGGLLVAGDGWEGLVRRFRMPRPPDEYEAGAEVTGWIERDDGTLLVDIRPFDPARFRLGATVSGRVVNTSDRGIVLDLGGTDGRVMADRLPADRRPRSYQVGETVEARVIDVQRHERWFKLAVTAFDPTGFHAGDVVEARVSRTTFRAAFLDLRGLVGYVPEEEFGPRPPVTGSTVRAWVVRFDRQRETVVCSLRPFDVGELAVGQTCTCVVISAGPAGATIEMPGGLRGAITERGLPPHFVGSADRHLRPGMRIPVTVRDINPASRWIECTYRPTEYTFDGGDAEETSPFAMLRDQHPA
ncbi:MAG: S1 RNA-binding domain-containing protein [Chloroflexi bacterium]|nr:S1 RNA-binding domain-containing protein [Chloroflexota bacterium]